MKTRENTLLLNLLLFMMICVSSIPQLQESIFPTKGNFICFVLLALNICLTASDQPKTGQKPLLTYLNLLLAIIYINVSIQVPQIQFFADMGIRFLLSLLYIFAAILFQRFISSWKMICYPLLLAGVIVICLGQYYISQNQVLAGKVYEFKTEKEYLKCKHLYQTKFSDAYIILKRSDRCLYLRDLFSELTTLKTFNSKAECNSFIEENTLYTNDIPALSGGCTFNNNHWSVRYLPTVSNNRIYKTVDSNSIYSYLVLIGWIILLTLFMHVSASLRDRRCNH